MLVSSFFVRRLPPVTVYPEMPVAPSEYECVMHAFDHDREFNDASLRVIGRNMSDFFRTCAQLGESRPPTVVPNVATPPIAWKGVQAKYKPPHEHWAAPPR